MKGCSILAELLESGRDQPWSGNGPPQPQPLEGCVDMPIPWKGSILPSSGWEAAGAGRIKDVTKLGHQPLGPSRKEPTQG